MTQYLSQQIQKTSKLITGINIGIISLKRFILIFANSSISKFLQFTPRTLNSLTKFTRGLDKLCNDRKIKAANLHLLYPKKIHSHSHIMGTNKAKNKLIA